MAEKLQGVYPVIPTPLTEDGESVDEAALRRYIRFLLDEGGVHGIIPTGSCGEFNVLSEEERKEVVDITIDEVDGEVPVVVGTAACSTRDTIMYAQYAEGAGAAGVMIVHPYYCPPTEREVEEHFKAVAKSLGIPIMIYNNTFCTGYDMKPAQVCRLAQIDNISYIKESSADVQRVSQIIGLCGDKMTVFCGWDTLALESFALGAKGWVSGCADLIPRLSVELYELTAIEKDLDKARELYYKMMPLLIILESEGRFVQYVKAGCEILGKPVGPPRKPLLPPAEDDRRRLKEAIDGVLS